MFEKGLTVSVALALKHALGESSTVRLSSSGEIFISTPGRIDLCGDLE